MSHIASAFRVLRLLRLIPNIHPILWTLVQTLEVYEYVINVHVHVYKYEALRKDTFTFHQDISMGWCPACWSLCGICSTRNAGNI